MFRLSSTAQACRVAALALAMSLAVPLAQAESAEPLGASLDGLLAYARSHNREIVAAQAEAAAAGERVEPAGALPDPMFQLELMDATNAMRDGGRTSLLPGQVGETRYRITQPLPFWGKRDLKEAQARAEAGRSGEQARRMGLDVEGRIRGAWLSLATTLETRHILSDSLQLLQAAEEIARARYALGLVPQQDSLRAQSEISRLRLELLDNEQMAAGLRAGLNSALARGYGEALADPPGLPPVPALPGMGELVARLDRDSPDLQAERHGVAAAEAGRELMFKERYPDFSVGLTNNRPRDGGNSWDVMLEFNIPLQQSARRAREREAQQMKNAAEARLQARRDELLGRLGEAHARYSGSRHRATLLQDTLLPQARATLSAAQAGYETGQVDFQTLLEAQRQILDTRLQLLQARAEAHQRVAELTPLLGAQP